MAEIEAPVLGGYGDPAVGNDVLPAVEDHQRYLEHLKHLQEDHALALAALRKRYTRMTEPSESQATIPAAKVDEDIRQTYAAGKMSFDHACLVQLLRNTARPEADDTRTKGEPSLPDGDVAGHDSDPCSESPEG